MPLLSDLLASCTHPLSPANLYHESSPRNLINIRVAAIRHTPPAPLLPTLICGTVDIAAYINN
jgi:hypothetical protein